MLSEAEFMLSEAEFMLSEAEFMLSEAEFMLSEAEAKNDKPPAFAQGACKKLSRNCSSAMNNQTR